MTSIYNKVHRLKQQPGWSWEHFQAEINSVDPDGIRLKLLQNYYRSPHKKPVPRVVQIIEFLHNECFPSPFPEQFDRLMYVYRELKTSERYLTKAKDLEYLQRHVEQLLAEIAETDYLGTACLQWLLGNIEFDHIATYANSGENAKAALAKQQAVKHYQKVIVALEQEYRFNPEAALSTIHLYRVQYNMVACYLNAIPDDAYISHDAETLQYVRDSNYLEHCKAAIVAEPFQWSIARNGLRFSALLEDEKEVRVFFDLLLAIHPNFVDLSYEPYNQLSISVMEDYKWALTHVLTPSYLTQLKNRLKREGRNKKQHEAD